MIKNDKQCVITKNKKNEFLKALENLEIIRNDSLLNEVMYNAISSQIEVLHKEIKEYEELKNTKPNIIFSEMEKFPQTLIKARIIKGYTQDDLAQKVGLKAQQIQRYESNDYATASFDKLMFIAKSLELHFDNTKATLAQDSIKLEEYDADFIKIATRKLQNRRSLLNVNI